MLEAIIAIVVVVLIGGALLAYRHRTERGIESGISSFRRELRALAPRRDPSDDGPAGDANPSEADVDTERGSGEDG